MIKTNLSQANLTNAKMNSVNLTDANLTEANMLSAKLIFAKMIKTKMARATLTKANLAQAAMNGADLSQAKMIEANLTQANLTAANMTEATLNKAHLTEVKMIKANLSHANLTEADLTTANLTQAKMIKANLSHANLTEANLTSADLKETDLTTANLTKADLTYAWLKEANLTNANLSSATMIATNLTHANLTGAKMMGANLSNANLFSTDMNSVDLTDANLTQAWMIETNLTNANLTQAKMILTDLTHVNLTKAKMNGANLSQATLSSAQMNFVDLTDANLADARLSGTNLAGANLSHTNLTHANLTGANLTDTNLTNANLTNANLTNVNLSNIDLHSAILEELDINNTNFAGANLNNTLTLALPNNWSARNLETKLNHFNHQGSLLTSIASIDDRYNELKIKLAWQLISSLKASNVNLKEVTLPLLNIFIKTPFSTDKNISTFVNQLMSEQQKNNPSNMLRTLEQQAGMANDLLNYFNQQPQLMASKEFNNTFISALLTARTQGINIVNGITIDSLYEKYLNLPKIQQLVKQEEIKGVFGDYEGNADWADTHAANYLLLSPTKPGRTLIVSENILNNMLHPNQDTKWDNIVLFQDGKCLSPTEYNLTQCYQQEFPLFSIPFKDGHYQDPLHKLIETLDLGERFKPLFLDALNSKSHNTKLVDDIVQQELNKIFSRVIDAEEYQLKEQNYDQIINLFHLTSSTNREKAEHLFSLATVFSRYTSKVFFGTEVNSPIILRYYAYALMEKAHQIDPSLLSDRFAEWKKQLLGIGVANNSTCTNILSDDMTIYARQHCNDTFKKIIPPAWR